MTGGASPGATSPVVRVESWDGGGARHLCVVAQGREVAAAFVVSRDGATGRWAGGSFRLEPSAVPHDRLALLSLARPGPMASGDMESLGLLGFGTSLAERAVAFAHRGPRERDSHGGKPRQTLRSLYRHALTRDADVAGGRDLGRLAADLRTAGRILSVPGGAGSPAEFRRADGVAEVDECVARALSRMAGPEDMEAFALLGPAAWTAEAHEALSEPGTAGERRRQAVRLYPALAGLMGSTREVMDAAGRGRPFEGELAAALAASVPHVTGGLTVAALRRMRSLPSGTRDVDLPLYAAIAAQVPVDWLPATAEGWDTALRVAGAALPHAGRLGVPLGVLSAHVSGDWAAYAASADEVAERDRGARAPVFRDRQRPLKHAWDVARALGEGLVGPLMASRGHPVAGSAGNLAARVSASVLYAGKSLPGIDRVQRAWHDGLARQEAMMPSMGAANRWPAAFPAFTASNGVVVDCLTDEARLKAEGAAGPDAHGVPGMSHCVGSYGRECYVGDTHVASLRDGPGHGAARLSTVEFTLGEGEPFEDGGLAPPLAVVQHMGRANGPPPEGAVAALRELLRALGGGLHPLDPEAFERRDVKGYEPGYDWKVPGNLELAFEAWREHLPRDLAEGGLAALADRVEAELGRLCPPGIHVDGPGDGGPGPST